MHPIVPRLFCFGFEGTDLPTGLRPWLEAGLSGAILFRRNLHTLEQIRRLTATLAATSPHPLLIGVDQEGGRVTRLPPPFLALPAAAAIGRLDDPLLTTRLARAVGAELKAAGINWNLAPVLDIHTNSANPVIGDRAYGSDPELVARHGVAVIRGLAESGVLSTGKHFPGHGDTEADSHLLLPVSRQTAARWRRVEFLPFRRAIAGGAPMIMVAHILCPTLDTEWPASLSSTIVTRILRDELGFDGIVASDDLEMGAIRDTVDVGEAAVRFLEAGGDLILICRDADCQRAALHAVDAAIAVGRLSARRLEASLARIARWPGWMAAHPASHEVPEGDIGSAAQRALLEELEMRMRTAGVAP